MKPPRSIPAPQHVSRSVRDLNPDLYREVGRDQITPAAARSGTASASKAPEPGRDSGKATTGLLRRRRKVMNRTETEYAGILETAQSLGEIVRYDFEGITLRWGNEEVFQYTPDFLVVDRTLGPIPDKPLVRLIFVEVKGAHIRQKDWDRFRHARDNWPLYEFRLFQKTKEGWVRRA